MFPQLTTSNLKRHKVRLPEDFQGEINLLLLAFLQWQQADVDTWIPLAQKIERARPGFAYYELPVLSPMGIIRRTFINEGMRAGIPNDLARERTLTLYVDQGDFLRALGLPLRLEQIYAVLLGRNDEVLWWTDGRLTPEKERKIEELVDDVL